MKSKKDIKILELKEEIEVLQHDINFLEERISILVNSDKAIVSTKKQYAGTIGFDFWPIKDWIRFEMRPWSPGRYFQICIGPFRLDFWEE